MSNITAVRTTTIKHQLVVPIHYGNWIMRHREFAMVRVDTDSGVSGFSYGISRDGPIHAIVARSIASQYEGSSIEDPREVFFRTLWANHAVHAAGIGMRALSLVDLATWDALARMRGVSIVRLLGGEPCPLPATAIVGYPPTTPPDELAGQIMDLRARGWRRFKVPISPDLELSETRLRAAREAAGDCWLGFDINMVLRSSQAVLDFESRVRDLKLGWIEDVVPPGDAHMVAEVRAGSATPVAMGDEQGGSYHPQALLTFNAIDVLRVDATTNGGISRMPAILGMAREAGVPVSPHMFPHVHSRLMAAFGEREAPIEWGIPGTGVHPMDDDLEQPVIRDGLMLPLSDAPGFGPLVARSWIEAQDVDDPDGALQDLPEGVVA